MYAALPEHMVVAVAHAMGSSHRIQTPLAGGGRKGGSNPSLEINMPPIALNSWPIPVTVKGNGKPETYKWRFKIINRLEHSIQSKV
mmetsp:Transcript_1817/g.2643  ORF Transcript_1817/g.2643 Transcript_1817/m.2643 type:complete len:86 (+) Transcript_1817:1506-1763(+)